MTRIHDMGGRFGYGAVVPDPDGTAFEESWHARALALTLAAGALGSWNIDMSRHARERLHPREYARFSYFEKWLAALANLLVETGALEVSDLLPRASDQTAQALSSHALKAEDADALLGRGSPTTRDCQGSARFSVGDSVRARRLAENRLVPGGHTRLPAYAAGASGRVLRHHGFHVFPDSNAHGLGEAPQPLYAVAFPAAELWVNPEHPHDEVVLDLWESYLEPVQ
ncbi:MAG: nitrile hydratase subunit beta [Boseongicola sp.]|nr:nitrile hydratase subunit beta [Boseongicola sp.]